MVSSPNFSSAKLTHAAPAGWRAPLKASVLALALVSAASARAMMVPQGDLAELSLEELANIEITSVSKKAERLSDAAASVFVITGEDIRRSGANSLPEALRLAPNLQVAQVSASGYAITARGFNGSNNSAPNKLLVLIDGRSVYTPLFSGVFWDVQDVVLEDIDRIEVISGPGSTLWGVNAVNGVVNIITKPAGETQGGLVALGGGNRTADAAFRYGGKLGNSGSYRVYGKRLERRHTELENGAPVNDAWHRNQGGFRMDLTHERDRYTLQANIYRGSEQQPAPGALVISGVDLALDDIDISGGNVTGRWDHALADGSSLGVQMYYDRSQRKVPPLFGEKLDILDFQLQHSMRAVGRHTLTWGINHRASRDRVDNRSPYFGFLPADVNQRWTSIFAQDEIALDDDLHLTLGARSERNDYTGSEFLPSARLAWKAGPDRLLWAAASRTVRAPSRLDADAYVPRDPPFLLKGGPQVRSEVAKVFEMGYRAQASQKLSYSVTVFRTDYDHLRTQEIDFTSPGGPFLLFDNRMKGMTSGLETWGSWQAMPSWRLSAGFTALKEKLRIEEGSNDEPAPQAAHNDPAHTFQLRSSLNVGADGKLDVGLRHVAALGATPTNSAVPAYTAFDARFEWQLHPGLNLSLSGQNLFGTRHPEYGPAAYRSDIPGSVYLKLVWRS